jgi:hypothetical protein
MTNNVFDENRNNQSVIRALPSQTDRVESGPVQFGDDLPGVFIRGDYAGCFALALKRVVMSNEVNDLDKSILLNLQKILADAVIGSAAALVKMDNS